MLICCCLSPFQNRNASFEVPGAHLRIFPIELIKLAIVNLMESTHHAAEEFIHDVEEEQVPALVFLGTILAILVALVGVFAYFRVNPMKADMMIP